MNYGNFTERMSGATGDGITSLFASYNSWKAIMNQRNKLVEERAKIYSVYFERGTNDNAPYYGLSKISTEGVYKSNDGDDLVNDFKEIATKIKDGETPHSRTCQTSTIEIENYKKISKIKIGSKDYISDNLQTIKDQITPIEGTDNGTLNLNQVELNGEKIFKTNSEITITYEN